MAHFEGNPGRFEDKTVIVTGASQGIGKSIAERFASEGAEVMLTGRRQQVLDGIARQIEAAGGSAWAFRADVSDPAAVDASVAAAVERWDRIDVLVNNAGIGEEVPFLEIGIESWDRVLGTNLRGAFLMGQAVAREQVRAGGGCIVHIASIDGSGGDGPYASYNASKAGLLGLNRTMALELAEHGIRVNCVSPGFTHTEMTESAVPAELIEYLTTRFARVPMRRLVTTGEIAAAVAFLASDDASAITGIDLTVDCGLTANWYILETLESAVGS
jgi:NAD(P)-dependent dehydrogenase (short-subunit alcohol dehydrogenase family)